MLHKVWDWDAQIGFYCGPHGGKSCLLWQQRLWCISYVIRCHKNVMKCHRFSPVAYCTNDATSLRAIHFFFYWNGIVTASDFWQFLPSGGLQEGRRPGRVHVVSAHVWNMMYAYTGYVDSEIYIKEHNISKYFINIFCFLCEQHISACYHWYKNEYEILIGLGVTVNRTYHLKCGRLGWALSYTVVHDWCGLISIWYGRG